MDLNIEKNQPWDGDERTNLDFDSSNSSEARDATALKGGGIFVKSSSPSFVLLPRSNKGKSQ